MRIPLPALQYAAALQHLNQSIDELNAALDENPNEFPRELVRRVREAAEECAALLPEVPSGWGRLIHREIGEG
jgi:hypothetical protein